jgi:hypothetical protein
MPIHDVSVRETTRAARCPSAASVFSWFSVLRYLGTPDWLGFSRNSGVFAFLSCIRLVDNRRWSDDSQRATRHQGEGRSASQEETGFSPNSTSKPDKTPHVVLTHRTSKSILHTNHGLCSFFLLCLLSGTFSERERAMTSQLFCFFPGVGNIQGWSRNHQHTTQTEQDGRRRGSQRRGQTPLLDSLCCHRHHSSALGRTPFPLSVDATTTIRMIMVGRKARGLATRPLKLKTPAWLLATTPPRRAQRSLVCND